MLSKVTLKLKSKITGKPVVFEPGQVVVVVGPNGAGKSLFLRDLMRLFTFDTGATGSSDLRRQVVEGFELDTAVVDWMVTSTMSAAENLSNVVQYTAPSLTNAGDKITISVPHVEKDAHDVHIRKWCTRSYHMYHSVVAMLQGTDRHNIISHNRPNPDGKSRQPLYDVGFTEKKRDRFTKLFSEALGLYPAFDFTTGAVSLRLSHNCVPVDLQMKATRQAQEFMNQLPTIDMMSDGHRAVAGLYLACTASDYRLLLVDETEAFLHPPLQRLVGKRLAELADENDGTLLAVTHSEAILEGCLSTGMPLTILRMNNEGGEYSAEVLDHDLVRVFTRKPILRASSALEALFCQTAVVCEGESDYVIYSEINHRLDNAADVAIPDTKFISTFGKGKVNQVVKPLRKMGIPAAAVCDFDLLTGDGFPSLMEAANMPAAIHRQIRSNAGNSIAKLPTSKTDPAEQAAERKKLAKNNGLRAFTGNDHVVMRDVLDRCAEYGVFICPVGEIEQWYPVCKDKSRFVTEYFDYLGDEPGTAGYKLPEPDGIWEFVRDVAKWTKDPDRKGMPYAKNP